MEYGFDTLAAAAAGGADVIVLCDTNGGSMPWEVAEFVDKARELFPETPFGIHTHNDSEVAVANSLAAVRAGAGPCPGHDQWLWRTLRQRQSLQHHSRSHHQAGLPCLAQDGNSGGADASVARGGGDRQFGAGHASALCRQERISPTRAASTWRRSGAMSTVISTLSRNKSAMRRAYLVSDLSGRGNLLSKAEELGLGCDER